MGSILGFFKAVRLELSKVSWPKRDEVVKLTLIVFAVSGIIGAYVGSLDYIFTRLLGVILTK